MAPHKNTNKIPGAINETRDHPGGKISEEQTDNENSDSSSEESNDSGEEEEVESENSLKRKRCYHYTLYQITELETFYSEFPGHRREQREELAREIGLDHSQVKFWLQNKWQQHCEGRKAILAENERLKAQNYAYQLAIANSSRCLDTLPLSNQQKSEISKLREEINRKSGTIRMDCKCKKS